MYTKQWQAAVNQKKISLISSILFSVIFILLLFIFWGNQIPRRQYFLNLSLRNLQRQIKIEAPRGIVTDRNGLVLAENRLSYNLYLTRENIDDLETTLKNAAELTGFSREIINKRLARYRNFPDSHQIPLKKDVSLDAVIYIESRSEKYKEFSIGIVPTRKYNRGENASHLLGYISEISQTELAEPVYSEYDLGDYIGRSGIEKKYQTHLRGDKGLKIVQKDNLERLINELEVTPPEIGASVRLTIDYELQAFIEQALSPHSGTAAVVDLKTGGILAMVSTPNYNPNLFTGILEPEEWSALINNPENPLRNKFIQGIYSPGSIFKIVVTLAALEEKMVGLSTSVTCFGSERIYGHLFHCWYEGGHGRVNIYEALKHSCNIYFYRLGRQMDVDVFARYAISLGLGSPTQLDLPNENTGIIPTKLWKRERFKENWYPGETISVAIGQGYLSVTPAQILQLISTVALRGRKPQLHVLKSVTRNGEVIVESRPRFTRVPVKFENFEVVIEGLFRVVNREGTGKAAKIDGLDICGKTGTVQVISKNRPDYKELIKQKRFQPHSWFVSFAPREQPEIAMIVLLQNGGDAGIAASQIARTIYGQYFKR